MRTTVSLRKKNNFHIAAIVSKYRARQGPKLNEGMS